MRDRTLGIILTVLVVFLIGIPALACMCLGLSSFFFYPILNSQLNISPAWINSFGAFGLCIGFFFLLITIVISYLLLHRRVEAPAVQAVEPVAPQSIDKPAPPSAPDEPLPPPS